MSIVTRMKGSKKQYAYMDYYTDIYGNRKRKHSKWFKTQKECKDEEALFLTKNHELTIYSINFKVLANEYIEYSARSNTNQTRKDKLSMLENHLGIIADRDVMQITAATLKQLRDYIDTLDLSTSRKNRILGFANSVFKFGMKFHGLQSNPMALIDRFKESDEERLQEMNIYTPQQFKAFTSAIDPKYEEYKNLYFVLYWTGMRLNEALSLTFNDYTTNSINIYRQWKDGKWTSLKTKGSKRKIAIDNDIYQVLDEQYQKYKSYSEFTNDWFIFGGYNHLSHTTITRIKNETCESAELPQIRIHDFRHSHASNLIEAGVNMYKISKRLGHSSVTITMDRYGHLIDTDGDEILSAITKK